jgi:hypothetical protein
VQRRAAGGGGIDDARGAVVRLARTQQQRHRDGANDFNQPQTITAA